MATRIKIDLECENGHWVGVTDDSPGEPGRKVGMPTHCPHPSCGAPLSPWRRRHKASDGLKGSHPVPVT